MEFHVVCSDFPRIQRNSATNVIGVRIYQGLGARCHLVSFPQQLGIFVLLATIVGGIIALLAKMASFLEFLDDGPMDVMV